MSGKRGFWLKRARKLFGFAARTKDCKKSEKAANMASYAEEIAYGDMCERITFKQWIAEEERLWNEMRQDYRLGIAAGLIGG